jgi:hypothetical protein
MNDRIVDLTVIVGIVVLPGIIEILVEVQIAEFLLEITVDHIVVTAKTRAGAGRSTAQGGRS